MPPVVRASSNPCIVSMPMAPLSCCLDSDVDILLDHSLVQSGFTAIASFRARSYTARKLRELTLDSPQLFHVKHNFGYEKGACFT